MVRLVRLFENMQRGQKVINNKSEELIDLVIMSLLIPRTRLREKESVATNGGVDCEGTPKQSEACNTKKCKDECDSGKIWLEDADSCPTTCADLTHQDTTCVSDEDSQPGCRCPRKN